MIPKTFIFIGRSGCGKGTQANLLDEELVKRAPKDRIVRLETGKLFRDFIQGATETHLLSKKIYETGGLQPEFLTVHLWSDFFILNMTQESHLIIDGTPRVLNEALILDTAIKFYNRPKPQIIHINVSREWSEKRMLERKRQDDTKHDILQRLNWFDTSVVPAIEYYKNNDSYSYIEVDGERAIEDVHKDIISKLNLS